MNPRSLLIILMTAVWVSVTTLTAATTNAAASLGPSVSGQLPVYVGTDGQLLSSMSTNGFFHGSMLTPWVDTNNNISLTWKRAPQVWEFSGTPIGDWTSSIFNSGTTSQNVTSPDDTEQFVQSFSTGTLTNGGAGYRLQTSGLRFNTQSIALEFKVRTPSALSSDTDGYELYAGFGDTVTDAFSADAALFIYTHSLSNGVWSAKTKSTGGETMATGAPTTPPTVAINTWYNLLIEGTSSIVNFWVSSNNGVTWQYIGSSTSNIPIAAGRETGIVVYIRKTGPSPGGTTSRTFYIGRCVFWPNF